MSFFLKKICNLIGVVDAAAEEAQLLEEMKREEAEDYDLVVTQKRTCKIYKGTITHLNDR